VLRSSVKFPIKRWAGCLEGEPAFVLGNSPSILGEDLTSLEDYFTIGMNRIFKLFEPTILFWQDKGLYEDGLKEKIDKLGCIKVCREQCDPCKEYTNFRVNAGRYAFVDQPQQLQGYGCSAGIAVQMAVAMGCGSVILLGCDGEYLNGKTDFYGNNKQHRSHTLRNFSRAYDFIEKECPVPIFNCSTNSRWPRLKLAEVIEELNPSSKAKGQWQAMLYR